MATHTIKAGDTPWSLAVKYVGAGTRWKELCAANPQLPKHATYGCVFTVGKVLTLPESWAPSEPKPEPPLYAVVPAVNPTVQPTTPVQPVPTVDSTTPKQNVTPIQTRTTTVTQPVKPPGQESESFIPGLPGTIAGIDTNYLLMGTAGLALIGLAVLTTGSKKAAPAAAAPAASSPAMAQNPRKRRARKSKAPKRGRKSRRSAKKRGRR